MNELVQASEIHSNSTFLSGILGKWTLCERSLSTLSVTYNYWESKRSRFLERVLLTQVKVVDLGN